MWRAVHRLVLGCGLGLAMGGASWASCGGAAAACEIDGREYHIKTPAGADAPPAVMFLHGWGGSGSGQIKSRALVDAVLAAGFAFVAPTGQPRGRGRSGYRWNAYLSQELGDDVAFLVKVAEDAAKRHGIDRSRILLAGFSGGGMMTWRAACDAPETFAAYAPVSGLFWRPLPEICAAPVRFFHTHGWADTVVPIEGRSVAGGRLTQGDLFTGLDLMRRTNSCAGDEPDSYDVDGEIWRRRWSGCAEGSTLELALHPGGHKTPKQWAGMVLSWFQELRAQ